MPESASQITVPAAAEGRLSAPVLLSTREGSPDARAAIREFASSHLDIVFVDAEVESDDERPRTRWRGFQTRTPSRDPSEGTSAVDFVSILAILLI